MLKDIYILIVFVMVIIAFCFIIDRTFEILKITSNKKYSDYKIRNDKSKQIQLIIYSNTGIKDSFSREAKNVCIKDFINWYFDNDSETYVMHFEKESITYKRNEITRVELNISDVV